MTIKDLRLFQTATPFPKADVVVQPEATFMVDRLWKISWLNKRAEQLLHLSAHATIGQDFNAIFSEQRFGGLHAIQRSLARGHSISKYQTVFFDPANGSPTAVRVTAQAIPDAEGNFSGAVVSLRDTSDSAQSFSLVLKNIADGVFTVDKNLLITSFNPAAQRILGWTEAEVLGTPCLKIFGGSLCGAECILGQSIQHDNPIVGRLVFPKDKHGRTIPISISAAALMNPDGEVIGGVGTFRDMTQIMTTDLILESVADGVFTVDRNWRITSFNRAAEIITGWKRHDAVGKLCAEVFQSDVCGQECPIAQSLYAGKAVANRTVHIRDTLGKNIPISVSASPLVDHEGTIIGGVETFRDLSLVTILRKQIAQRYSFDEIISKNAKMQNIFSILPEIAHSDSNVLVLGESGTGKEILARAIHNASTRKDQPFVAVSCGALPETLLESELFGYKAGAFTDARQDKQGRFAAAEKGTLFLDEIGDISLGVQVKLLRVLQEKRYEPLGSNKTIEADARIIAATNRDLHDQVQKGLFREDLFYRLNVVRITLPPLRERKEDIPLLVQHMITLFSAKTGKDIAEISDAALALLLQYDFPGNIRELKNIIEYAFILCPGGLIQPAHLPDPFAQRKDDNSLLHDHPAGAPLTLEEMACQTILRSLERHKWKKMAVCRELAISKDTLRRKIAQYQLSDPAEEDRAGPLSPTHTTEELHGTKQHQT
ncbi:sigma 54-interacting transcriptional regulator [Hydrosulfovibrio ferrireducens]|jgi:PAS domain S-box-containing protein|uniref:sigma 54-interacting transcriptional regulator n=1 Tax=Hydrosulfovibrio ferrireducens TaxID=2934181 RepID=UPI003BF7EF06